MKNLNISQFQLHDSRSVTSRGVSYCKIKILGLAMSWVIIIFYLGHAPIETLTMYFLYWILDKKALICGYFSLYTH